MAKNSIILAKKCPRISARADAGSGKQISELSRTPSEKRTTSKTPEGQEVADPVDEFVVLGGLEAV